MNTVRDILKKYGGKSIILFLRDGDTTSMHKLDNADRFKIDILDRKVTSSHISTFKNTYHIELSI